MNDFLPSLDIIQSKNFVNVNVRENRMGSASKFLGDFFVRSAKWIPSGGAGLVSGRGNFRPGFSGRDWRSALAEPNFKKLDFFASLNPLTNPCPRGATSSIDYTQQIG
ncbi:hypothetical protein OESDEN_09333 [Oesophagostomum dentatum]|uniref:Uncharacterized protein n=1 Tax=Oesophagostomum dentatum TaxID=61180 RepID=A0A0B1SZU7_OESDE|nr:hypothetical protein OESDEN_09333 [Oesophagostomum dentatum]